MTLNLVVKLKTGKLTIFLNDLHFRQ